jgi:1,4-dihydroxy-2-naphthoate octaprenyltransferase
VKRHTLPYYLGKSSLYLFAALYYVVYASVIAMVVFKILPLICLLLLVTVIPVQKNIREFFRKQMKTETFVLSIKNYIIIMGAQTLLIFLGRWIAF